MREEIKKKTFPEKDHLQIALDEAYTKPLQRTKPTDEERKAQKKTYSKDYWINNKEKQLKQKQNRRARDLGAKGSHTLEEWVQLKTLLNNCCNDCGSNTKKLVEDHIIPLTKDGTDYIDNIQPLCKICNGAKTATFLIPILVWNDVEDYDPLKNYNDMTYDEQILFQRLPKYYYELKRDEFEHRHRHNWKDGRIVQHRIYCAIKDCHSFKNF